jgi:hypothetical protein
LAVAKRFSVQLKRLHNDSTSIAFCGQYRDGRVSKSGQRAPAITYGYSKNVAVKDMLCRPRVEGAFAIIFAIDAT